MAFNPSGTRLAVIAMDDDHSLAIYDLNANGLLLTMKGDRERILSIKFINDTTFVTTGVKHFKL